MTPAETKLIEVAKRYTIISTQVSQAYSAEQSKLSLDLVLSAARLSSPAGTRESLEAIKNLSGLTDTHKTAMEKIFTSCAGELTTALSALPADKQAEYRAGLLTSIHGQLTAQSQFYENRAKWAKAARTICTLLEKKRSSVSFDGESILFAEPEDHERFATLMESIEDTHRMEVEYSRKMLECYIQVTTLLGFNPRESAAT